jgi:hypothetical protein
VLGSVSSITALARLALTVGGLDSSFRALPTELVAGAVVPLSRCPWFYLARPTTCGSKEPIPPARYDADTVSKGASTGWHA